MRQHEAVVQLGPPAHLARAVGGLPEPRDERAHEELLGEAHPRVRRHLEGAQLDEPEPAGGAVGAVELVDAELGAVRVAGHVDEQVAEEAVDEPGRAWVAGARVGLELAERELQLVEAVVARLVDARRLARRADEHAGEQVRERRMIVPVADEAAEQVGPPQDRAVARASAPPRTTWLPPPVPRVAAVEHELLGAEPVLRASS